MFMTAMKETLNEEFNYSTTENGALGYRTTGKALLDLNFSVASLRSAPEATIINKFRKAYYEDKTLAMKWLFYCRDVRGGLGERRLFRTVFEHFAKTDSDAVKNLTDFIPEYGRWDDMLGLLDTPFADDVCKKLKAQLEVDLSNLSGKKPVSLLAKWLPSANASSKESARLAHKLQIAWGYSDKNYRKTLSALRTYLDVVERKMSAGEWNKIDYQRVPSRANLVYNPAFLKHDEERRREFLSKVSRGEAKINAGTLYPHDIVTRYNGRRVIDQTLEELWKALPNTVNGCDNTIVVADGSGSMYSTIGGTAVRALDVANALAIYFAERSSGQFRDQYITFSSRPQLVSFANAKTLFDKIRIALTHSEVANTNIEAVFNLILTTAVANNMEQAELPANILIISDMEFDSATYGYGSVNDRLFATITKNYEIRGYKIPRLVFWNVNSRTGTIPVKENDLGVALVSGFSSNIAKMVMSNTTDPYLCLLEVLNAERYTPIEAAMK